MSLVEYGIQKEQSDIRVHVGFESEYIAIFETEKARQAIKEYDPYIAPTYVNGVKTAEGWLVRPEQIEGMKKFKMPDIRKRFGFDKAGKSTSKKGQCAVDVVRYIVEQGKFPYDVVHFEETPELEYQYKGIDGILTTKSGRKLFVEIKADGKGCAPFLYVQKSESNAQKQY